ncbi:MAG: HupE/UreJ family protein [Methylococcales bacterium]|nr:HupE/UreJ family protein [Methylococcales bacterium]
MKIKSISLLAFLLSLSSLPAHAHTGIGAVHGLIDGSLHPLIGLDHLMVMLAIGLWAARRGGRALWLLPSIFLIAMGVGAALHFAGLSMTAAESWVAFSVLAAGMLVWRNTPMSSALAAPLVAVFALGHGYVHAVELANGADALGYSSGFLLTTAMLHGLGVAIGLLGVARLKMISTGFGLLCAVVGVSLLAGV